MTFIYDARNLAPIKFDSSLVIIWCDYDEVLYWSLSYELFEITTAENLIHDNNLEISKSSTLFIQIIYDIAACVTNIF